MWAAGQVNPDKENTKVDIHCRITLFSFVGQKGEKFLKIFQIIKKEGPD